MSDRLVIDLAAAGQLARAGGKAVNLCKLIAAGFPVPGGFVVTTDAYALAHHAKEMPAELADQIKQAYREMDSPPVAVRSSATAEDMAGASMAGQYETFLNVRGEAELLRAVGDCWRSLESPTARAYLAQHGIDLAAVDMAVVVQRQVSAEAAGVLFTVNPRTASDAEMLAEASWGLGEAVVSGAVRPDVIRIDAQTGRTLEYQIAEKEICLPAGADGMEPVPADKRKVACLGAAEIRELWRLGRRAAEHFDGPQDIEWAIAGGEIFLLQARPITALEDARAPAALVNELRDDLGRRLQTGRGPWVEHNLGETLPHPTPLTWSVIGPFMTGAGGFGEMYRLAGFDPSPAARKEGFVECIAGRVYMDLSRAGEMFFAEYPFAYDLDLLRLDPNAAQSPPTVPTGGLRRRMRAARRVAGAKQQLRRKAEELDRKLLEDRFPAFEKWCRGEKARDLSALDGEALMDLWSRRERRVLGEFAPICLLPSLIEGAVAADLRAFLDEHFWDDDSDQLVRQLSVCRTADVTVQANEQLYQVACGERGVDDWLARHGHRAAGEFDLAVPRWRERGDELKAMADRLADGADPAEIHERRLGQADRRLAELRSRLAPRDRRRLDELVGLLQRYLRFREDSKGSLMAGYDLLRDVALEAGRRLGIGDDVFMLTKDELRDALSAGAAPRELIAHRRQRRRAEARLALPRVIDAESLATLGRPPEFTGGNHMSAAPVSNGWASGPARIVLDPTTAGELGAGYVLVCPSTDPSWTPLFINAAAVVLERGGALSHGAVVARELGVPAVVLEGATQRLAEGEQVTVDGTHGAVGRGDGQAPADEADPDDTRIPRELTPPVPGRVERLCGRLVGCFSLLWGGCMTVVARANWCDTAGGR